MDRSNRNRSKRDRVQVGRSADRQLLGSVYSGDTELLQIRWLCLETLCEKDY